MTSTRLGPKSVLYIQVPQGSSMNGISSDSLLPRHSAYTIASIAPVLRFNRYCQGCHGDHSSSGATFQLQDHIRGQTADHGDRVS